MKIEEHLRFLAGEIAQGYGNIVDFDQVSQWPKNRLEELTKMGVLIETQHGSTIICHECGADCSVEPQIVQYPDGRSVGLFYCREQQHNVEVPMEHFKRWEVLPAKLAELGYEPPIADEELTNEQAVELLGGGISRGTISKWVNYGLLKDNGRSGRDRRVLKSSVLLLKDKRDKEREHKEAEDERHVQAAKKKTFFTRE
jgi:hypothetical protein